MIDLNELANMPGAGKAQRIIQAEGFWNDAAAPNDGKMRKFVVEVSGTYTPELETETHTIEAECAEDAVEKAWDESSFDNVHEAKVVKVLEDH